MSLRFILLSAGALAGLAFHLLIEEGVLEGSPITLHRFVVFLALVAFPAFGLLAGPLSPLRAAGTSALLAAVTAILPTFMGLRFSGASANTLDPASGLATVPFMALAAALIPFVCAAQHPQGWRSYTLLFETAWQAGVKLLTSLLFLGLFWAVYFLSAALLTLAKVDILEDLVDIDGVPYTLSGAVLGVALAVTCELDRVIATLLSLVLRLLRLLVVPVTAVITLFVAASIAQGLGAVFSRRSAAATMLAMSAGATLLAIATLDRENTDARHPALALSLRIMGAVLPVMAAIAVYALWLRVDQHGWTPERVLAALCVATACLFIAPIAFYTPRAAPGWQGHTRQALVWSSMGAICLGVLWFTPLLNAQRISANSQIARLTDGRTDPTGYSFWPIVREWGDAGTRAVAAWRATGLKPETEARIARAEAASSPSVERKVLAENEGADIWNMIRSRTATIPPEAVLPDASALAPDTLRYLASYSFEAVANAARLSGETPRLVAVNEDFDLATAGLEWMLVAQADDRREPDSHLLIKDPEGWGHRHIQTRNWQENQDVIATLLGGDKDLVEPTLKGLQAGPVIFLPNSYWK